MMMAATAITQKWTQMQDPKVQVSSHGPYSSHRSVINKICISVSHCFQILMLEQHVFAEKFLQVQQVPLRFVWSIQ